MRSRLVRPTSLCMGREGPPIAGDGSPRREATGHTRWNQVPRPTKEAPVRIGFAQVVPRHMMAPPQWMGGWCASICARPAAGTPYGAATHAGIADGLARAVGAGRVHGVRGIAEQRHRAVDPRRDRVAVDHRVLEGAVGGTSSQSQVHPSKWWRSAPAMKLFINAPADSTSV